MKSKTKLAAGSLVAVLAVFVLFQIGTASNTTRNPSLPFADQPYVLGHEIDQYVDFMMSGGPPPDGIPAIDDPQFLDAGSADLQGGDMVIGIYHEGEARAYPQNIMVWHEIVNDAVGGLNVTVTYCPLTATAQAFKRGDTTFGVSGQLLNSNMVIFDRDTRSYFSQINATGLTGEHRGRTLAEVNVIWTTWDRWRTAHPDTRVLSERTGHLRNYDRDPYGSYNPLGGYYAEDRTIFPLMNTSNQHRTKEMVLGGRNSERSVHFVMEELARQEVLHSDHFLAVYDPALDTGYIYETGGQEVQVESRGNGSYEYQGQTYAADRLPLNSVVPVEGFYFAWRAFYPDSESAS